MRVRLTYFVKGSSPPELQSPLSTAVQHRRFPHYFPPQGLPESFQTYFFEQTRIHHHHPTEAVLQVFTYSTLGCVIFYIPIPSRVDSIQAISYISPRPSDSENWRSPISHCNRISSWPTGSSLSSWQPAHLRSQDAIRKPPSLTSANVTSLLPKRLYCH